MTSRRYYRKSRKLAVKSLSLKSLGTDKQAESEFRTLKCRSLSREELKYLTISRPSNFVHVASATRDELIKDIENNDRLGSIVTLEKKKNKKKCEDPTVEDYADVGSEPVIENKDVEEKQEKPGGNESFLWRMVKVMEIKGENNETDNNYDDVGLPAVVVEKEVRLYILVSMEYGIVIKYSARDYYTLRYL